MTPTTPISLFQISSRLWGHVGGKRQKQFIILLSLMIFVSFAEVVSIGSVIPFLGILTAPDQFLKLPVAHATFEYFNFSTPEQLLLPVTIIFAVAAVIAGALRLTLLWASIRFSYSAGADLSISIYRRTLYQPYWIHIGRNSSEIINGIANKTGAAVNAINAVLTLIGSSIILSAIIVALLVVDPVVALSVFFSGGVIYLMVIKLTRKRQLIYGQLVADESTKVIKILQEGLGGIRDILIDGSQPVYCDIFSKSDNLLRRAQGNNQFIGQSPRYLMETLGMILIAALAYVLMQQGDTLGAVVPTLGALALGAQRLLPVSHQAYSAWSNIQGAQASIQDVLELLDQPMPVDELLSDEPINFSVEIILNKIGFRYSLEAPFVFENVYLKIAKGSRVGIVGSTGAGKSTLIDIFMGLLTSTVGTLEVDGVAITQLNCRSWQSLVAHVPQAIFLADSTIEENIAFGVPKDQIDHGRVTKAAIQAQLHQVIAGWENGYKTIVGERGVRLSGGQRQRIGIARALYKNASIIVFDEATSALDAETEGAVMDAIDALDHDLTVLIIAHRVSTLKNCSSIVQLGNGKIEWTGNYFDYVEKIKTSS